MNSILSYTILILLIFLVIYLIVKFVFKRNIPLSNLVESRSLENINSNKKGSKNIKTVLEEFSSEITPEIQNKILEMELNFGLNQPNEFYGFSIESRETTQALKDSKTIPVSTDSSLTESVNTGNKLSQEEILSKLNDYFYKVVDVNENLEDKDTYFSDNILSKYLGIYNILVVDSLGSVNENDILLNTSNDSIKSINTFLEKGFYDLKNCYGFYDTNDKRDFLNKNIFDFIANVECYKPKLGKFSELGVHEFIDFGRKGKDKLNLYIKNARYLIEDPTPSFSIEDLLKMINYKPPTSTSQSVTETFTSRGGLLNFQDLTINQLSEIEDGNIFENNEAIQDIYSKIINNVDSSVDIIDDTYVLENKVGSVILPSHVDALGNLLSFEDDIEFNLQMSYTLDGNDITKYFKYIDIQRLTQLDVKIIAQFESVSSQSSKVLVNIYKRFILILDTLNDAIYYYHMNEKDNLDFSKTGRGSLTMTKLDAHINTFNNNFVILANSNSVNFREQYITVYTKEFKWEAVLDINENMGEIKVGKEEYYYSYKEYTYYFDKISLIEVNSIDKPASDIKTVDMYLLYDCLLLKTNDSATQISQYFFAKLQKNRLNKTVKLELNELKINQQLSDILFEITTMSMYPPEDKSLFDYLKAPEFVCDSTITFEWDPSKDGFGIMGPSSDMGTMRQVVGFQGSKTISTSTNTTYISQFKREVAILQLEYLFAMFALLFNKLEKSSVEVKEEYINKGREDLSSITDSLYKDCLELMFVLLKFRQQILKDEFIDKFNCKYMTYLFYSFNKGWALFGDYIKNTFSVEDAEILRLFFKNYQFEGLYKLFVTSINIKCDIYYENETDNSNIREGFSLSRYLDEKSLIDFNTRQFFFYERKDEIEINKQCKFVNYENCNPIDTNNLCSWKGDKESGICSAKVDTITTCFDNLTSDSCNSNKNCSWDNKTEICSPKNCISEDGLKCKFEDISHCKKFSDYDEESDKVTEKCFDMERIMYITRDNLDKKKFNPNNFFNRNKSHLNKCIDEVYDSEKDEYVQLFDGKCKKLLNCNLLKRRDRHNNTEFRTCVNNDLIEYNKFFSCYELDNEHECDSQISPLMSCFWQDGKCHKRDAPMNWVTPGSKNFGLEDMTNCKNFINEYSCPEDRCVWLNEKCIAKEDHPYYQLEKKDDEIKTTDPVSAKKIPMRRDLIDCEAINNKFNNDEDDHSLECTSFKCKLRDGKCLNNIGGSCSLNSTKESCLDPSTNYNPESQTNNCRWSENETDIFGDSKPGFCTDTRMRQPCGLYSVKNCPTELKIDNFGNSIPNSNHCSIDELNNKCVNNVNIKNPNTQFDCQYDYLNTGNCNNSICRELELKSVDDPNNKVKKCVNKQSIPCSLLSKDDCFDNTVHLENCFYDNNNERCETTQNFSDMVNALNVVNNINDKDYKNIRSIRNDFNDINIINRENKKYFLKNTNPIFGFITKLESSDTSTNQIQRIYTSSDRLTSITKNDDIIISTYNNDNTNIKIIPDTRVNKFKVYNIDVEKGIIEIQRDNSLGRLLNINNEVNLNIQDDPSLSNKIIWTIEAPNIGLFDSYQYAQAIEDSLKINNFYKNLF